MTSVQILPLSFTWRPASFRKKKAVFELTAVISSYSASLISVKGFFSTLPTVLIAMSGRPIAAIVSAKSFSIAAAEVRSAWKATASAPAARIAASVSSVSAAEEGLL